MVSFLKKHIVLTLVLCCVLYVPYINGMEQLKNKNDEKKLHNRSSSELSNKKSSPHVENFFKKSISMCNLGKTYTPKMLEEIKTKREKKLAFKKELNKLSRQRIAELEKSKNNTQN